MASVEYSCLNMVTVMDLLSGIWFSIYQEKSSLTQKLSLELLLYRDVNGSFSN